VIRSMIMASATMLKPASAPRPASMILGPMGTRLGEADTDAKKQALFEKVRAGSIRVLLGSTQKMGTGTNVQRRLVALHHLDAPWKPAEVEQREGRILRQGNENAVAAAASAAMIAAGSEWFGEQPIVTSGERAGVPHTTYARRPLRRGDCVLIEMSGVFHRHFAPMMRTAFIGEPPSHVLDMYAACRAGLEAAMAVIRPGITSSEAHEACEKAIAEFGYGDWFKKRLGYSVGTGLGFWNEGHIIDLKPDDESALQAGMLFHLPPALRDPFRHGVGVSETVLITPEGCEQLGKVPRELHVAPARRPAS
jgi:Xaa-Pro aminopeptidase